MALEIGKRAVLIDQRERISLSFISLHLGCEFIYCERNLVVAHKKKQTEARERGREKLGTLYNKYYHWRKSNFNNSKVLHFICIFGYKLFLLASFLCCRALSPHFALFPTSSSLQSECTQHSSISPRHPLARSCFELFLIHFFAAVCSAQQKK